MDRQRASRFVLRLFFLSGLSGIVFEVLWIRIFTSILGSTTQSVSAVVTTFLLGLGIGTFAFGRLADRTRRHLALYGWLELGTAASALAAFWLFVHLDGLYAHVYRATGPAAARWIVFLFAFAVLTVPTSLIGGTLPVLVRHLARSAGETKSSIGRLYAMNTLGASVGSLGAVALVWAVGYRTGYHLCLLANVLAGLLALGLARATGPAPAVAEAAPGEPAAAPVAIVLPAFAISGFSALVYEVVWFRLLEFLLQGTMISFALILAVYLGGLGLGGSLFGSRGGSRSTDLLRLACLQGAIGILGMASLPFLAHVAESDARLVTIGCFLGTIFLLTLLFGGVFPLAGALYSGPVRLLGRSTGTVFSANNAGAVLGSISAGFLLIPRLGTSWTYFLASALNLSVAAALLLAVPERRRRFVAGGVLAALAAASLALWRSGDWVHRYYLGALAKPDLEIVEEKEGSLQTVLVLENAEGRRMLMGGPFHSGATVEPRRQTQRLQAHLPMLVHRDPRRVLEIGYGVGEILRTVLAYGPDRAVLVEIDENMTDMADRHLGKLSGHASRHDAVEVAILDGRHYLRMSEERFDVILSDSMILVSEASLRLYTLEHFQAGREHLAEGGVFLLWLPLNVGTRESEVILATFREVFPESLVWLPLAYNPYEAFVVGFRDRATIDLASFLERFERVAAPDLACFGWDDPAVFLGSFRGGPELLEELARGAEGIHSDMDPVLDFLVGVDAESMVARILDRDASGIFDRFDGRGAPAARLADLRERVAAMHRADAIYERGRVRYWSARRARGWLEGWEALSAPFVEALASYAGHPASRIALAEIEEKRGEHALAAGDAEGARARFEASIARNPSGVRAHEALASLALDRGDLEGARRHAEGARVLSPYSRIAARILDGDGESR